MIRNIVFDMGMVLLRYQPFVPCLRYARGDREQALRLKAAIFDHPDWTSLDGGRIGEEELIRRARERLERPEDRELVSPLMKDWYLDALYPMPGMEETAEAFAKAGYRLYILSNAGLAFRRYEYKLPPPELFSGILVSAEERTLKPDPCIFHRLCEKFGLDARECLFIDDNPDNVRGAESVGMTGYLFADGDAGRLRNYVQALER